MEWIAESVLDALNDFERKPEISPLLDEYLKRIAKNGEIVFPWSKLKPVLKRKLDVVLDQFYDLYPVETSVPVPNFETFNFDSLKKTILQAVDSFTSAPFTIQRLCELVTNPQEHYNRIDKYMRGIEKNVLVVSTVEPRSSTQGDGNNANINPIMNGIVSDSTRDDNDTLNGHETTDSVTSSNLNTPSNHVLLENFANVFPSAACIPSASNICINREIDNNFMGNSECVETHDIEFETPSRLPDTTTVQKDEDMDTTEDDQANVSSDSSEITSGDSESPEHTDVPEPEKAPELIPNQLDPVPAPSETSEDAMAEKTLKSEAVVSVAAEEVTKETPTSDPETTEVVDRQQDDTVSQSDDKPQSTEVAVEAEASANLEAPAEVATAVPSSQNAKEIESSDQNMELEPSSNAEEPPV